MKLKDILIKRLNQVSKLPNVFSIEDAGNTYQLVVSSLLVDAGLLNENIGPAGKIQDLYYFSGLNVRHKEIFSTDYIVFFRRGDGDASKSAHMDPSKHMKEFWVLPDGFFPPAQPEVVGYYKGEPILDREKYFKLLSEKYSNVDSFRSHYFGDFLVSNPNPKTIISSD